MVKKLFQDYLELKSKQSKEHIAGFQKYNKYNGPDIPNSLELLYQLINIYMLKLKS